MRWLIMPGGRVAHIVMVMPSMGENVVFPICGAVTCSTRKPRAPGKAKRCAKCAKMRKS